MLVRLNHPIIDRDDGAFVDAEFVILSIHFIFLCHTFLSVRRALSSDLLDLHVMDQTLTQGASLGGEVVRVLEVGHSKPLILYPVRPESFAYLVGKYRS